MWVFLLSNWVSISVGAGVVATIAWVWHYGRAQYKKGAADTVAEYREADLEGAKHARKTAEQTLRNLDGVGTDKLLERTNGFRD